MSCADVQPLIDLYAVGALEPDVADEVAMHAETCPDCEAELERAWQAVQLLRLSVPPAAPSDLLRQRILRAAGTEVAPAARESGSQPQGRLTWLPAAAGARRLSAAWRGGALRWAAAAALVPLVLSAWLALQVVQLQQQMRAAERAIGDNRSQAYTAIEFMGKALETGGAMARVDGTEMAPAAQGFVYYMPSEQRCVLVTEGLPMPGRDSVYQVWLQVGDKRVNGGVFMPENTGHGMLVVQSPMPLASVDAVGITVEPKGGSEEPHGSRYMWGRLKKS
jgi:hypothetical protein